MIENVYKYISSLPDKPPELRMSSAGDCPKKLELDYILGTTPLEKDVTKIGAQYLRMSSGTFLHAMLQDLFKKTFGEDFTDVEKEVSLITPKGLTILGHMDGRLQSKNTVIDFKAVSEASFQKVVNDNKPLDANLAQNNLYGVASSSEWQSIIYFNRSSCEFKAFTCEVSPVLGALTLDMFDSVKAAWESGVSRPRPYHDKSETPCWYCNHKEVCYKDFQKEVSTSKAAVLNSPVLLSMAKQVWDQRKARLEAEKIEEDVRQKLGFTIYSQYKVKEADLGDFTVSLVAGKNDNLITKVKEKK